MATLVKRQFIHDDDEDGWWSSTTGYVAKWVLFGLLFLVVILWLVGGYFHAKRRIRKGKRLMGYHRFLVPRYQRGPFPMDNVNRFHQYEAYYGSGPPSPHGAPHGSSADGYAMRPVNEQLPAYNADLPPTYQPPHAASKENGFVPAPPPTPPPPTPPPPAMAATATTDGNSDGVAATTGTITTTTAAARTTDDLPALPAQTQQRL